MDASPTSSSTFGRLGKRIIAWVVIAAAALLVLKLAIGTVVGLVTTILSLVLIVAAVAAVIWAVRRL